MNEIFCTLYSLNQVSSLTIFSPSGVELDTIDVDEEWGDFFENSSGFGL